MSNWKGRFQFRSWIIILIYFLALDGLVIAQTREEKVRNDRKKVEAEGFWIYNDLAKGIAEAKKTGKPLLVVLRCIPCEECVKLDDDLINQDKRVRPLLDKFVCVRGISTNGLDLSLFQFDYDQSFAVFFFNGDGTIYGRYGTRSHRKDWQDDVSIEGLAKAMEGALELHAQYPMNKLDLVWRKGEPLEAAVPELLPMLKGKYGPKLATTGKIVPSCIHCHQIGDAQRQIYRDRKEPIPEKLLFSYPHPKAIGLILDPKERATVLRVVEDSPAEAAGLRAGDVIEKLQSQPLLSIADVQWVLHLTAAGGSGVQAEVLRDGRKEKLTIDLAKGWRQRDDLSWRASTWGLRRMALGGLLLEGLDAEGRKQAQVPEAKLALRVKHVGQYGPHAAAQNAGFRKDDIVVSFDGRTNLLRETEVLAYALTNRKPGERVPVTVLRGGKTVKLSLPMQN